MDRRRLFGAFSALCGAIAFVGHAARAAEVDAMSESLKERRSEALQYGPGGLVDLACTLYGGFAYADAFRIMQEAAEAGDDAAALYLTSYLSVGIGTPKNEDAADRILMTLVPKIRKGQSARFATLEAAAYALFTEKCAPNGMGTWASIMNFEDNCRAAPDPKPAWCM